MGTEQQHNPNGRWNKPRNVGIRCEKWSMHRPTRMWLLIWRCRSKRDWGYTCERPLLVMGTSVAILVTLVNLPSLSSPTSFSSPSLLSFPVAFNAPSSPVVVIPPDDQPEVNEDLTRSPCPSAGYHRDPQSCSHFYICTDLWAIGAQFQVQTDKWIAVNWT